MSFGVPGGNFGLACDLRWPFVFFTPCCCRYDGALHVVKTTLKKEGVKGLFRGWAPMLLKVAPTAGISFGAYSAINDWFSALRRQRDAASKQ